MLLALYTSRILLRALGVADYGLYNVVGGVVAMFAFLKTAMVSASQRFLSFELGKTDSDSDIIRVFGATVTIHLLISLLIILICETIGLWFLNTHINIPPDRVVAANCIFHFSVISICVYILVIPYEACVISHENMHYFAYVSIGDACLKLIIAFAVSCLMSTDRLIVYGFLIMTVAFFDLLLYYVICRKSYRELRYSFLWDKLMLKRIFGFSIWTFIGQFAVACSNYGASILVNMFYSVTANAAMGIAQQVNNAINGLIMNFQTAYQPQITKLYASNELDNLNKLIFQASKVSFFLIFIVSLPVLFNIDELLSLWLGIVPEYTGQFCIFFLLASMMNAVGGPLWMSIFATGRIHEYQFFSSVLYLSDVIIVYVLFLLGYSPVMAVAVKAVINFILIFIRIWFCSVEIKEFSKVLYLKVVLLPIFCSVIISLLASYLLISCVQGYSSRILYTSVIIIVSIASAYYVGLSNSEREITKQLVLKVMKKR
jgi:O-antigen/teichoic acid export membrane protein